MNYIEVAVKIPVDKTYLSEILIAFLAEFEFDSFSEDNNILYAYVIENKYDSENVSKLISDYNLDFSTKIIPQINWNQEWEKNFNPIIIDNQLAIKAPFHKEKFNTKFIIEIEPKMSFGTGHHATTYMMCKLMASYNFENSTVLDMGCGTGILAIYAALKKAKTVTAIDIDEWAYQNTIENTKRNSIDINIIQGDVNTIPNQKFDYILANINLNILKQDIPKYSKHLRSGSFMFLSGFFINELPQIVAICQQNNLSFEKSIEQENWVAAVFKF